MPFRIDPEKWKNNSKNSESILNSSCLMLVWHILLTGDGSRSKPLIDPVTLTFTPHKGPVYSVSSSPHHRNLFVSCSSDTTLRLHNVLQVSNHLDSRLILNIIQSRNLFSHWFNLNNNFFMCFVFEIGGSGMKKAYMYCTWTLPQSGEYFIVVDTIINF